MPTLQITVRAGYRCPYIASAELNGREFRATARDEMDAAFALVKRVMFSQGFAMPDSYELKHVASEQDAEIYAVEW